MAAKVSAVPLIPCLILSLTIVFLARTPTHADEPVFHIDPTVLEDLGARFDRKGLRSVADVLAAPKHPDHDWVRGVHERLVDVGQGSGVILYRTQRGAALLVTAAHVLPYEALDSAETAQHSVRVLFAPPITSQEYEQEVPARQGFCPCARRGRRTGVPRTGLAPHRGEIARRGERPSGPGSPANGRASGR